MLHLCKVTYLFSQACPKMWETDTQTDTPTDTHTHRPTDAAENIIVATIKSVSDNYIFYLSTSVSDQIDITFLGHVTNPLP